MDKILITGTGRCGTTFLIRLFSFLNFDTGFNKKNYKQFIYTNCNSGMERDYNENYYIIKNPIFLNNIKNILEDSSVIIKTVIIPIRDFKLSALSRVNNNNSEGGLVNSIDEQSQIQYYNNCISNYIYYMTKYNINTIFIDFDKMISDKTYLFNKIINILNEKNISFIDFSKIYDKVTLSSKPKAVV
jgi:hypothetical protein